MEYKIKKVDGITLLALEGELLFDTLSVVNDRVIKEIADPSIKKLIIDLSKVECVDSHGIGFLVTSYKNILSRNGRFSLISPAGPVEKKLRSLGLLPFFLIFNSRDDAIASASEA